MTASSPQSPELAFTDPDFGFRPTEVFWYEHYDFFEKRGYRLRARYKHGMLSKWIQDWQAGVPLRPPWHAIEAITARVADPAMAYAGVEATRLADGTPVFIKCISALLDAPPEDEIAINEFLSSEPRRSDPRNRCATLLETFVEKTNTERHTFLVFPFLRNLRMSPFRLSVELLTLAKQLLEGMEFLHENNIAHRDMHIGNVAMETAAMWPSGVRPLRSAVSQIDVSEERPEHDRIAVSIQYRVIDLGLATHFKDPTASRIVQFRAGVCVPPECFEGRNLTRNEVLRLMLQAQTGNQLPIGTPERTRPYDPFKADIFQLGILLMRLFINSAPCLTPLVDAMTDSDPEKRPTATECLRIFSELTSNISRWQLLRPATDISMDWEFTGVWGVIHGTKAFVRHWLEWLRLVIVAFIYGLARTV
ncbi:hypothetical protein AURDEDRAFT_180250 [Auricularia subglabra TFB-10046 SS5]|nr:hypothetical protein AURDEDRAFT_180250 [Auricularia subglabra TFB-10046 SS5]